MAEVWDDDGESAYERRKHRRSAATISITLICSEEWNRKVDLLNRAREASPLLSGEEGDRGKWFVCNERYGGNTLFRKSAIIPYAWGLHFIRFSFVPLPTSYYGTVSNSRSSRGCNGL